MKIRLFGKGKKEKHICSSCKTGRENLVLDEREWTCPFVMHCDGEKCLFYEPIEKN